jgi:hypothetical protein
MEINRPKPIFKEKPSRQSLDDVGWEMPDELDEYAPINRDIRTTATEAAKITGATVIPQKSPGKVLADELSWEKKEDIKTRKVKDLQNLKEEREREEGIKEVVKRQIFLPKSPEEGPPDVAIDDLLKSLAAVDPEQGDQEQGDQEKRGYKGKKALDPDAQLLRISQLLLDSSPEKYSDVEMEVKFGTRGIKPITKIDYDNVVKKLYALNFTAQVPDGTYALKIQSEFLDKTGVFKSSPDFDRFRVEIKTLPLIEEYCRNDNIGALLSKNTNDKVSIMRKQDVKIGEEYIKSADFNDFNFRVTYKTEEAVYRKGKIVEQLISNWERTKKQFRYINRVTFIHPDYPFSIDLSIVRSSSTMEKSSQLIKTYNIKDSNVFENSETYEIEIEAINTSVKQKYGTSAPNLIKALKTLTKTIVSALQRTNYPVSYDEQRHVLSDYMRLLHEEEANRKKIEYKPPSRVYSNNFIGPSSTTLQLKHITPVNPDMNIPNITAPFAYCVTDKADGDRHLRYINGDGKIYLINSNMDIMFTGSITEEPRCLNTLIDGELILHNKESAFINTFAAFDIYFIEGINVRDRPFTPVPVPEKDERIFREGCRLLLLKNVIKILEPTSIVTAKFAVKEGDKKNVASLISQYKVKNKVKSPMTFICKSFYPRFDPTVEQDVTADKYNIFEGCKFILQRMKDGLYNYNTDGLIFTPTLFGVGGSKIKETGPLKKSTWEYSFKWKPAEFNTIDFLVTTKKGADNADIITPIFESGLNMQKSTQLTQYKILELRVGFDETKHGYINPCQDLLEDRVPQSKNNESTNEDSYKPKKFSPSDPPDVNAGTCHIMLEQDDFNNYQMFTEERHVFTENTIVEFRYDLNREGLWRWVPLRVRNDKTADFRNGKISCNDYKTANDNWYSIHNPITEKMIATGEGIPTVTVSDDVYYNRVTSEKRTTGLRDFHNLYVKKMLIQAVSKRNGTLIDYACGKGGDFPKWIASNLGFVMGVDISKDNIENRVNGACSRYLSFRKDFETMPYALFVWGNSSLNIRTGKAAFTDKGSAIIQSVFGQKPLDKHLGPAVARQYAKCADGFDVSSCQFALHYMFENRQIFYNFMRNIAECTKQGGYFIGTSYDGKTVFNRLKDKEAGESIEIYTGDTKIWALTKDYNDTTFENDESSLGKKILVYQESINQVLPEYLVNYDFFTETMAKYGFQLMTSEEAKKRRLPDGTGTFIQLHNKMMADLKHQPLLENDLKDAAFMQLYEKEISFLNRYFVYQKVSTLDVEKLTNVILGQLPEEVEYEALKTKATTQAVNEVNDDFAKNPKPRPKAVKLRKTLLLEEATEALDESIVAEKALVPENAKVVKARKTKKNVDAGTEPENPNVEVVDVKPAKTRKKKTVEFNIVE